MARTPGFRSSEACFLKNYKSATDFSPWVSTYLDFSVQVDNSDETAEVKFRLTTYFNGGGSGYSEYRRLTKW